MPKKKKQTLETWKLPALLLIGLFLFVFLATAANNSDDILNSFSTSATMFGFALLMVVPFLLPVLGLLMILDAAGKKKWLWVLLILVSWGVGSIFYYLLEKPKTFQKSDPVFKFVLWAIIALVAIWILSFAGVFDDNNPSDGVGEVSFRGTVSKIDLTALATDGPGVFHIKDATGEIVKVYLSSGESSCDRDAIKVPNVSTGDKVLVIGERNADESIYICQPGTYIKRQ